MQTFLFTKNNLKVNINFIEELCLHLRPGRYFSTRALVQATVIALSTFTFTLPITVAKEPEITTTEFAESSSESQVNGLLKGLSSGFAVCRNLSTGQAITILLDNTMQWNCTASGLEIAKGDVIRVLLGGNAR